MGTLPGRSAVLFAEIQDVAPTPDGGTAALDIRNTTLYRFASNGTLRDSLGRRGQGPGETLAPAALLIAPDGSIGIYDMRQFRMLWWDATGRHVGATRVPAGWLALDAQRSGAGPSWLKAHLMRSNQVAFTRVAPDMAMADSAADVTLAVAPAGAPPAGPSCIYCAWTPWPAGGVIVAAADTTYALSRIEGRGIVRQVWRRQVPPRRRSAAEVSQLTRALQRGPGGGGGVEGRPTQAPQASPFHPRVLALGVDDRTRLWALVNNDGETQAVLDVFAADGAYLTTFRPAAGAKRMRVAGNQLIAWGTNADDEPTVWVYRIDG